MKKALLFFYAIFITLCFHTTLLAQGVTPGGATGPGTGTNTGRAVSATFTSSPTAGGSIQKDKATYYERDTAILEAIPNEGYRFTKWSVNNKNYQDNPLTLTNISRTLRVTAYFELITYRVKIDLNEPNAGEILSSAKSEQLKPNDTVSFTAMANCGYTFSHWVKGENLYSKEQTITIEGIDQDLAFSAIFEKEESFRPEISISEIMPCNLSTYMDSDYYNFSGFIEFANQGDCRENMKSYTITHYKRKKKGSYTLKWEWQIGGDFFVNAKGENLLYFDERGNETSGKHAPYKLDSDGGYILLKRDGELIDSLAYEKMDAHISYGRESSGATGYMNPSPMKSNNKVYETLNEEDRCETVQFSEWGGIKEKAVELKLTCETSGAAIYYTTDGSEPNEESGTLYQSPITIEKNSVIRARAIHPNKLRSAITTHSYIYSDASHEKCGGFTVPIVSLTVDNDYFYDDMIGIYVTGKNGIQGDKNCSGYGNYNQDWQRPLNFEYIVDGEQVESREAEASVVGGCSIAESIKSLALKTSKKTGRENYDYHYFASKPDIIHKTLHLRNGGNDHKGVRFRDGLMQTFAIGMNIDYQAYQPVAYYINGKYIGLMNLNERTNADYVTSNHGVDEDNIDLVVVSDQKGISASKGDLEAYNELVDYLSDSDPNDVNYFKGACERMDMDEYIDYQILQQYMANIDWPGNNTKIWRKRKEGSLFRWILYDMDFGLGFSSSYNYKINMFNWCQGKEVTNWGNKQPWMTKIFANLCKNKEFKLQFYKRYKEELETRFSHENIAMVFDSITALVDAEYCATMGKSATSAAKSLREYALNRQETVSSQLEDFIGDLKKELVGEELLASDHIHLYPTLVDDYFEVSSDEDIQQVTLYNINGSIAEYGGDGSTLSRRLFRKDIHHIPSGVYYIRVTTEHYSITQKIIKQ